MTYKSFISTVLAAALALSTLSAAPARAGSDTGKIVAGVAVGAILGAAIASNNNRQHRGGHVSRKHHDPYGGGHHRGYKGHGYKRTNLPGACRVHRGHRSGYSGRCLSGYNYSYSALPSACAVRIGGYHGTIYRDRCLNQYGYY